jgi:hypothetical protein
MARRRRHRDDDWARPELPARDYVSADAWTNRPVDAIRFASSTPRPQIRVLVDAELELGEAERLMGLVLDKLYGTEDNGDGSASEPQPEVTN